MMAATDQALQDVVSVGKIFLMAGESEHNAAHEALPPITAFGQLSISTPVLVSESSAMGRACLKICSESVALLLQMRYYPVSAPA